MSDAMRIAELVDALDAANAENREYRLQAQGDYRVINGLKAERDVARRERDAANADAEALADAVRKADELLSGMWSHYEEGRAQMLAQGNRTWWMQASECLRAALAAHDERLAQNG